MHGIALDLPPDPLALARKLAHLPGLALLHAKAPGPLARISYLAASPVETKDALFPPVERRPSDDLRVSAPKWIGVIPYECGRGLEGSAFEDPRPAPSLTKPRWMRYGAVVVVDHEKGSVLVVGDDRAAVRDLAGRLREPGPAAGAVRLQRLDEGDPREAHLERIREAQRAMLRGEISLVNLARRLRFGVTGKLVDLYEKLACAALPPFGAALDLGGVQIAATSPELFLSCDATGLVRTAPIKGTRPRGHDAEDDARQRRDLDEEPKERRELGLVVKAEWEALSRIAKEGTLRMAREPHVATHRTVHHRLALLEARLAEGTSTEALVRAMFPSSSVTGVPKRASMQLIARLEPFRRGLYTGAYGMLAHDGSLRLAMAIRALSCEGGEGHYFTGGGIVEGSDPARELVETEWKAKQLERLG